MASGKTTREYLTIRRNLSLIVDSLAATVDPARLALKLLEVDLITDDVVDRASVSRVPPRERIQPIVMAVMAQIQLDMFNYQVLMGELRTLHPRLAQKLETFHTSDLELNVVNAVSEVRDWQALAQQLDYDPIHQQELQTSGQNPDQCRKEMLTTWARKDQRASWKKLAEALDRMEQEQVAQRIREEFIPHQDQTDEEEVDTPTPSISKYGDYLRGVYSRQVLPCEERRYRPRSTKKYINLALISKKKESRAEMDAYTKATIHGDVDDVIEMKTEITPQNIGRLEDGSPAQCVLVQGAPGVGKTTLAWELCRQWRSRVLFSEYLLIVLLKMRDRSIQEATSLSDLFKQPDPELQAAVCKDVVDRNGKSILILLEGYDELPPDLQERSIFSALIEGKELPNATILVTSRTSSSDIVYEKCKNTNFQHIEVVGFTGEQVESYIMSAVEDEKVLEAFRNYLKKYPHIHGLMYIPLNCGIILDVFISSGDEEPPTTQTELYTVLANTILCRYLSSHPVHGKQKWHLSKFCDLPQDVYSTFLELCKIAYGGIVSNRLIFSDIPAGQETLGLMQSVPELYESKAMSAVSHNFLHLTLQEYLSAVHISTFSQHAFVEALESMFGKKHLTVVLRFLAGLTKLAPQKESSFISWALSFFTKSPIQYVKSLQRDALGFIDTMHWLFEAQEKKILSQVLGNSIQDRNLSSQFLSPFDCYVLGYLLANSQCTWKLNLKNCSITEEGMSMLASNGNGSFQGVAVLNLDRNIIANQGGTALSMALQGSAVLSELRLGLCSIGSEGITKLTETLKTIHTLRVLDISGSTVGLTAGKNLAQIVSDGNLSELNVSYCGIESGSTCDLARALYDNSRLQNLCLRGNPVGEAGAEAMASMLQHNDHLKLLDLTGCSSVGQIGVQKLIAVMCRNAALKLLCLPDNLESSGRATQGYRTVHSRIQWARDISTQAEVVLHGSDINSFIVSALRLNSVLTKLTVRNVNAGGIAKLATVLSELPTLKSLDLWGQIGPDGVKHLATVLRGSHALTNLDLWSYGIKSTAMSHLCEGLSTLSTLRVLNLSGNRLGTEGTRHLATALRWCHALTDLVLSTCGIESTAMSHLCEGLSTLSTLRALNLSWNSLGTEGTRLLATALRGSHDLTDLYLGYCNIESAAMSHLCEGLSTLSTLRALNLSGNSLGTEGTRLLATALRWCHALTDLVLSTCGIESTAMSHLCEGLSTLSTLRALNLSWNSLGTEGTRLLATALRGSHDLTDLYLGYCNIESAAMSHLCEGLSTLSTLRALNLSGNSLGTEGTRLLATALRWCHALTDLVLSTCGIESTAMSHLCEGLSTLSTLRALNLSWNSLGTEGTRLLATVLRGNHALTDLVLMNCGINSTAMSHLCEGLSTLSTLRALNLSSNSLGTEGTRHLAQLLKSSCSLTELELGGCSLGGAADVTRLLEALNVNTTVTKLTLS